MTRNSELVQLSLDFSIKLVEYYKWLCYEKKEFVLSRQILRSGTSIGANIHEAIYANSTADFAAKLRISLKEASETEYWFKILEATDYLPNQFCSLKGISSSLARMLIKAIKTVKSKTDMCH